jgi:hypothetical protein
MISPIVGDGTFANPYRAAVSTVPNVNVASVIPTFTSGPNIGKPKYHFALCLIATSNIGEVVAVTNAYVLPDYNLDGRMDGMESVARTGMVQSLQAYNLDGNSPGMHFDAVNADGDSYRDLITRIGQQIEPSFAVNSMSCGEVAQ